MVLRPRPSRSGITLTEILISILIMGVGMISLATLFPLGLLRLREAQRSVRSTYLVESAAQEIETRGLLLQETFTSPLSAPWYRSLTFFPLLGSLPFVQPDTTNPNNNQYDPWLQDTPGYISGQGNLNPYTGGTL